MMVTSDQNYLNYDMNSSTLTFSIWAIKVMILDICIEKEYITVYV